MRDNPDGQRLSSPSLPHVEKIESRNQFSSNNPLLDVPIGGEQEKEECFFIHCHRLWKFVFRIIWLILEKAQVV